MNRWTKIWISLLAPVAVACSVIPASVRNEAISGVPFTRLVENASQYIGQTVIAGGYVVEVRNEPDFSRIIAVQAPLGIGDQPKSKDLSQGRLIVDYQGFLDPEVYTRDREITVAGQLIGSSAIEMDQEKFPYLHLAATEIYLWEKQRPIEPNPYWYYWRYPYPYPYPYYYPWGWRRPYIW